jgi:hypothetical protein
MKVPVRKRGRGYIGISQPSYSSLRNYFTPERLRSLIGHSKVIMRFGYTGEIPNVEGALIINSKEGIKNASNKIAMKQIFRDLEIPSPQFHLINGIPEDVSFPLYGKLQYRSRGKGMTYVQNREELNNVIARRTRNASAFAQNNYYFEVKSNFTREYGVHISSAGGIFHAVRKMLREDAEERWFRNSENCTFFLPENPEFSLPSCWTEIEEAGKRYLNHTGLDIGRFDVQVNRDGNRFRFIEVNSSPSIGAEVIFEKYKNEIIKLLIEKQG